MTKKEILDYITETPGNTNRAVLGGMLDSFESGDNKEEIELAATENKVYTPDEGKVYKKVTVNVPAPPSDITTAEVTVSTGEGGGLEVHQVFLPILNDNKITITAVVSGVSTVPLYKGSVTVYSNTTSLQGTGDCQIDGDTITITGNCSIVIAN